MHCQWQSAAGLQAIKGRSGVQRREDMHVWPDRGGMLPAPTWTPLPLAMTDTHN